MDELLDLGMEDWIPVPEATESPVVIAAVGSGDIVDAVRVGLTTLLRDGRIRLYRGRVDGELLPVNEEDAALLLRDRRWYTFHRDAPEEERLFFVNVANIRESGLA